MNKTKASISLLAIAALALVSCEKSRTVDVEVPEVLRKADIFASDVLSTYYLWSEEVSSDLPRLNPDTCLHPIPVVEEIRYHRRSSEIDHWTQLTDDLPSYTDYVQGVSVTYGASYAAGTISNAQGEYFLVVNYVSAGSPAQKAGLKRGDIIITLDGKEITESNINDVFRTSSITMGVTSLVQDSSGEYVISSDVKSVRLTAVSMYEDPILLSKTFDVNGRKVGYLVYNGFDFRSIPALPEVFQTFKDEGVKELVLDLRYNSGGYSITETVLASLIAPMSNVVDGDIFQTEVYNEYLSDAWEEEGYDTNTYFETSFSATSDGVKYEADVTKANLSVDKLYVICSGSTASASEGLVVGLGPYVEQVLVGEQTSGKYCAGYLLAPEDFYNARYDYSLIKDWGMYVMVSKFADRDGRNAAEPDGLVPDIETYDNPLDGCQLGDENETMLKVALQAAGKKYSGTQGVRTGTPALKPLPDGKEGLLIKSGKLPSVR